MTHLSAGSPAAWCRKRLQSVTSMSLSLAWLPPCKSHIWLFFFLVGAAFPEQSDDLWDCSTGGLKGKIWRWCHPEILSSAQISIAYTPALTMISKCISNVRLYSRIIIYRHVVYCTHTLEIYIYTCMRKLYNFPYTYKNTLRTSTHRYWSHIFAIVHLLYLPKHWCCLEGEFRWFGCTYIFTFTYT